MLWTLLTLTSSATLIAGAFSSAKHANAGEDIYVIAIISGVSMGACNALTMYKLAGIIQVEGSVRDRRRLNVDDALKGHKPGDLLRPARP